MVNGGLSHILSESSMRKYKEVKVFDELSVITDLELDGCDNLMRGLLKSTIECVDKRCVIDVESRVVNQLAGLITQIDNRNHRTSSLSQSQRGAGESLMNGGIKLVVYMLFYKMVLGQSLSGDAIIEILAKVLFGAVCITNAFGISLVSWLEFIFIDALIKNTLTLAVSFIVYLTVQECIFGKDEELGPIDWPTVKKTKVEVVRTECIFVEDTWMLVKTNDEATTDITILLVKLFKRNESLQKNPLYIGVESCKKKN
ncbi:hypothetical protein V6N11_073081 [Hibiscus sabdariffa]|uniref:Uncharacterized protein n=1 Tax=Hibiscus sabdariffa TaxID=183260 RepID=A0ABR2NXA3_9ROSI